ncbi:MAG: hypothetical protein HF976_11470 [ANME-2 cluster archaeon]|nr:hypothetical protein [ANME-2 cluster archaeon]MBC2702004.1 hypothetical protein [ANME-2 cluster archaeon]MBC2706674.1 hypothetical protein [ANME-2 cluster archaeon]MBC2748710.1 hypothetical protein [ANME-2 cluster archaeon]
MNYKKDVQMILLAAISLLIVTVPAQAAFPEYFDVGENYYTVYGGPNISASLLGDGEFYKGDTVTVNINLMNRGLITGFKSENSVDVDDNLEVKLQKTEMNYEAQKTTAIGIIATLVSLDPAVKVKTGYQEAGSLISGQQTEDPVQFTIEIAKNARAGVHPLLLNLLYGYQENVQISGEDETEKGDVTDLEVGLWYEIKSQNLTIPVIVKDEADFEVVEISGNMVADEENMLYVTYKNVGELPVTDATVRISVSDPFSTTDDQAFIGSLAPGESALARFNLKVDDTATTKMYGINSEIKYEDVDGHDRISDNIKIQVDTLPAVSTVEKFKDILWIGFVLVLLIVVVLGVRSYKNKQE